MSGLGLDLMLGLGLGSELGLGSDVRIGLWLERYLGLLLGWVTSMIYQFDHTVEAYLIKSFLLFIQYL